MLLCTRQFLAIWRKISENHRTGRAYLRHQVLDTLRWQQMQYFRRLCQTEKSTYSLAGHKQASWSRENKNSLYIYSGLNDLCLQGDCPPWNSWSHRNSVTHGFQNWYVYFLTLITHKENISLAYKVNAYSSKPLLQAVSSSQFASASITPMYMWRWGLELIKHCHRSLGFMLQMAVLVLHGKVWVLERLQGGLYEQSQLQLFQQDPAADLRMGKTAVQQQLGERSEKRETVLQAPQSVQKEQKRCSRPHMRSSKLSHTLNSWIPITEWMLGLPNIVIAAAPPS